MARKQRQIVLCFDGTGNTFQADGTETNVLKICRMLERTDDQLVYYQPGIGTDISPGSLASHAIRSGSHGGSSKTIDLALGKSFDRHVLGGYRFLMRHYRQGTRIIIFGFSRGAYTARFLSEMLDFVGLLGPDNDEVIPFVWDALATFKLSSFNGTEARRRAFQCLKTTRETLCRPVSRVHFLGVFDIVNSTAQFKINDEGATAARTVRHAVSIDERRIKFRPTLFQPGGPPDAPRIGKSPRIGKLPFPSDDQETLGGGGEKTTDPGEKPGNGSKRQELNAPDSSKHEDSDEEDDLTVDIEELWFPGCHSDVGGGHASDPNAEQPLSFPPLVWMVNEARKAGVHFDQESLKQNGCTPATKTDDNEEDTTAAFTKTLHDAATRASLHDSLSESLLWRMMEHLPLRRYEIQPDGKKKDVRWPPPRGAHRGVAKGAKIHESAIQRMKADRTYRPENLRGHSSVLAAEGVAEMQWE